MPPHINLSLLILLTMGAVIGLSHADELTLTNGDTLHGTITKNRGDTLTFEIEGADKVDLPWDSLTALRSDAEITVITTNGAVITAPLVLALAPHATADSSDTPQRLAEIKSINPPAWETGEGWHASGMLNFSVTSQRGNANTDDIDLDGRLTLRRRRHRAQLLADLENDRAEDVDTDNKWLATADYDHFVTTTTFGNLGISFENNEAADLELRSLIRAGIGHALWTEPVDKLEGKLLFNYITETYYTQADREYTALGLEANLAQGFWKDAVIFYTDLNGTVAMESSNRLLGKAWIGARIPISHGLITSVEVKLEYDSDPAEGANNTDHTYRIKLGYAW